MLSEPHHRGTANGEIQPFLMDEYSRLTHAVVCGPNGFSPSQAINAFQAASYANDPARREVLEVQHQEFRRVLTEHGVTLLEVEPDGRFPYQMFTRDACFCVGEVGFCSSFRFDLRRGETDRVVNLTRSVRWRRFSEGAIIEGGDVLVAKPFILVGLGERTNLAAVQALRQQLEPWGWQILPIELAPHVLHLDTVLDLLPGTAVVEPSGLVGRLPPELRSVYSDVVELAEWAAGRLGTNLLAVDETTVIMAAGHDFLLEQLTKRGFRCVQLEAGEFLKLGGGFRCLTPPIRRKTTNAT